MSSGEGCVTRAPRYGSIATSPSRWSLMRASRTGVLETPSLGDASLDELRAGLELAGDDVVAQPLVDASLELPWHDLLARRLRHASCIVYRASFALDACFRRRLDWPAVVSHI